MNLIQELKLKFRSGDVVTRLLIINCTVFVTLLLLDIFFTLFSLDRTSSHSLYATIPGARTLSLQDHGA